MAISETPSDIGDKFLCQKKMNSKPETRGREEVKRPPFRARNRARLLEIVMQLWGEKMGWRRSRYFAAKTVISTSVPGVSTAPTAVRVGKFDLSTQAIQALFISSLRPASAI